MTSRSLDSSLEANSQSAEFGLITFVALSFPSGTVRVHSGQGTYTWGGNDWLGVGGYGSIDAMGETVDSVPNPVKISLSSITDEIIDAIRTDDVYGRDAKIYVGTINSDLELEGTPTLWVDGWMEKKDLNLGSNNGVSITIQDDAAKLRQRSNKRYTIEEHQDEFSGDLFFEFLPFVMNAEIVWAGEQVRFGFTNYGGFTGQEGSLLSPVADAFRRRIEGG